MNGLARMRHLFKSSLKIKLFFGLAITVTALSMMIYPVARTYCHELNSEKDIQGSNRKSGVRILATNPQQHADNSFAFNLFSEVSKKDHKNVLVSPLSAYLALSMTANGAAGATRKQMAATLGLSGDDLNALNLKNQNTMRSLNANKSIQLEIANAIYTDKNFPLKESFTTLCKNFYSAEAQSLDFGSPSSLKAINEWCATNTKNKIPTILDSLTPNEKMVLLNAIYFKGAWKDKFEPKQTADDKFNTEDSKQVSIRMMHHYSKRMLYLKGEQFSVIALPYEGGMQDLCIFLPDKNVSMATFQSRFNQDNWDKWTKSFHSAEVNLSLPKFKINYSTSLKETLHSMGMGVAFTNKADFSNISKTALMIGRVIQKTFMDVNEEGTEAAAVTAVIMKGRAATMPQPVVEFRVDRPFCVALRDRGSNELLFLGTIVNPEAK